MLTDQERLLNIASGLYENNIKLARMKNGEKNVPDFNRPPEKQKYGHTGTQV